MTVFFSDLVKFASLSTKCTPFQTVSVLNDLFSNFDAIIGNYDVYKVGDSADRGLAHYSQFPLAQSELVALCTEPPV